LETIFFKRILLLTVTALVIGSCTEPVEIKLDNSFTRLIVYGEISTDTAIQKVSLSRSANYFYNKPAEGVSDAVVIISDGVNEEILSESLESPGTYETSPGFFGIPGKTYNLLIQNVDINNDGEAEVYNASSYLPFVASIDSIRLQYVKYPFFQGTEIQLFAKDPAEYVDFYAFKVVKNGILQTDSLREINVQSDALFNGSYTNGVAVQYLDDANISEKVFPGDTITIEMYGITEEYFKFIVEAQSELFGSNPLFSGPPANISTNISNGALGFFTAVNIKRAASGAPSRP